MKRLLSFILLLVSAGAASAQIELLNVLDMFESKYYRDFHVRLSAEPAYMGFVRIKDKEAFRDNYLTEEGTVGTQSELKANLRADFVQNYCCRFIAYPIAGYTIAGFVNKADFRQGEDMSSYFLKASDGRIKRSGDNVDLAKPDESSDPTSDPTEQSRYKFNAKGVQEYVAVFRKAVSHHVTTEKPGTLAEAVAKQSAIDTDNIIISGPLDSLDVEFLRTMVKEHNLIRIDLSKAQISHIPEHALWSTNLYEIRLPESGLESIGLGAFSFCWSLLPFNVPEGVKCRERDLRDINENSVAINIDNPDGRTGHFDEVQPIPVSERTDLTEAPMAIPQFPGGDAAMLNYLNTNMKYPDMAAEMGIEGTVIVQAAIEADGTVAGGAEVIKSADPSLNREALRLVHSMPKWTPGRQNGQPVPTKVTIIVRFKL